MSLVDYVIFGVYMAGVMAMGVYFYLRNRDHEDYYVGGRQMGAGHIGLSIVATDVGGGFSIGLGGLGFVMGVAGSWLLFTGLIGAWLAAVVIIPRVKALDRRLGLLTYPDVLRHRYGESVAMIAAVVSGLGYLGFTAGQVLAGAKLASATIITRAPWGMDPLQFALLVIAVVTVAYTVLGGLKAVIYTDTIQWAVLLVGLILVALPVVLWGELGGIPELRRMLPAGHFSLTNVEPVQLVNWAVTIIPIWIIGMTLYQRLFACRDEKTARRAWYLAGLLEWPVMAFMGVFLGMCARVLFPEVEPEMGLPLLISQALPVGIAGLLAAAYFSAIMSTADSCLMASSGNLVGDVLQRRFGAAWTERRALVVSQVVTFGVGAVALLLASQYTKVLDIILKTYSFMVSGLLAPTIGALFWRRASAAGAAAAIIVGGSLTLGLEGGVVTLPGWLAAVGLAPTAYGVASSAIVFIIVSVARPSELPPTWEEPAMYDRIDRLGGTVFQHGPYNDRVYVMTTARADLPELLPYLEKLATKRRYGKVVVKCPADCVQDFEGWGARVEGRIPDYYGPDDDACFMARYFSEDRDIERRPDEVAANLELARQKAAEDLSAPEVGWDRTVQMAGPEDVEAMGRVYQQVFPTYPFPIFDPGYLEQAMQNDVAFFKLSRNGDIGALASAEMDPEHAAVEMTDFATLPELRGQGAAQQLLTAMENAMRERGFRTAFTIARAYSAGMNITFAKCGYRFGGTLTNNTNIAGRIESMNIWAKPLTS